MITLLGLDLTGRLAIVAGGGPIAASKTTHLLDAGARVRVVAAQLNEDLVEAYLDERIEWTRRTIDAEDLDDAWVVVTATGDTGLDAAVCRWAESRRIFCIGSGSVAHGTARVPDVTRARGLAVGVVSEAAPDSQRTIAARACIAAALDRGEVDLRHRVPISGRVPGGPPVRVAMPRPHTPHQRG